MTTLYGTSYFVTERDAALHYRDYCESMSESRALVKIKIADGEIHIGAPSPLKPNERLTLVDGGRRYAIIIED
jgi:hypothetical protein